jgi:hypothetical protein
VLGDDRTGRDFAPDLKGALIGVAGPRFVPVPMIRSQTGARLDAEDNDRLTPVQIVGRPFIVLWVQQATAIERKARHNAKA